MKGVLWDTKVLAKVGLFLGSSTTSFHKSTTMKKVVEGN